MSATATFNAEMGTTKEVTQSISISPTVRVPANAAVQLILISDQAAFNIPYTANLESVLGHQATSSGTYKATSCFNFSIAYEQTSISQIPSGANIQYLPTK